MSYQKNYFIYILRPLFSLKEHRVDINVYFMSQTGGVQCI